MNTHVFQDAILDDPYGRLHAVWPRKTVEVKYGDSTHMRLSVPKSHLIGLLVGAAILTGAVLFSPLSWILLFVLLALGCRIGVQTGADYVPHPVYDHPLFLPGVTFAIMMTVVFSYYAIIRGVMAPTQVQSKRHPKARIEEFRM